MKRLYLFRHSLTRANEEHKYCGSTDLPLSDRGKLILAEKKKLNVYPVFKEAEVYSSPLIRVRQTLEFLYPDLSYTLLDAIREMSFGIFENMSYEELKDNGLYQKWIRGDNKKNVCPKGESGAIMEDRVLKEYKKLSKSCKKEELVLFSHGGPIASIMNFLFPEEKKNLYQWQPDFACGWLVDMEGGFYESF